MQRIKKCNICGSSKFSKRFITKDRMLNFGGNYSYLKCENCGLVFIDKIPSAKELLKHYPVSDYLPHSEGGIGRIIGKLRDYLILHNYNPNVVSKLLKIVVPQPFALPLTNKKGKILDVGCGIGNALILFQKLGWEVYGKEISKEAVEVAKRRGLKNVSVGSDRDVINYPDKYFDVIRLYHVIEHVSDPTKSLEILKKKLKDDGELILATPNAESPLSKIFQNCWSPIDAPRHLFLFSRRSLSFLSRKNGLLIKNMDYTSAMNISGSLDYLIEELIGRRVSLTSKTWVLFYPIEWFLDKLQLGDSFVIRLVKNNRK